jgi:hypothetical protein
MMGMSCAFILTKSSDLPLYYFLFFLHIYKYVVIDSLVDDGYHGAFDYLGGFDPKDS